MNDALLRVEGLKAYFDTPEGTVRAVDGIGFEIRRGETVALLGESGCGKSVSALSLLKLLPAPAGRIADGRALLDGRDILTFPERDMRAVRGKRIAMIFQEPQTSLNPVFTVGAQIHEALPEGARLAHAAARKHVLELLTAVGIADPESRYDAYPHQLSGGMKQRVMIAMALAAEPDILIADEPTTALDVTIQAQILDLLKDLQKKTGMAILLITHDLGVVAGMADRIAVMYAGEIVEWAPRAAFFAQPRHPYSQKLFRSLPSRLKRGTALDVIQGSVPALTQEFHACRFADRCDAAWSLCRRQAPRWLEKAGAGVRCHLYDLKVKVPRSKAKSPPAVSTTPSAAVAGPVLLQVDDLKVHFPIHKGVLRRVVGQVKAVDGVSLAIRQGRTLALVGESGCGKTTVGKGILQLLRPTAGRVLFDGRELTALSMSALRPLRRQFQVIFQDPYGSLDPRMLVGEIIEEGMRAQGLGDNRAQRQARVAELLEHVGLPREAVRRYPHEFSGGQRARISIARALAVEPRLIVCDEPTSALDVSVQAQILNLLKRLQDELGLSYLFITHNLSVVEYLAHEIAVMYLGRIVERGRVEEVLDRPRHPYTQALLSAVPTLEGDATRRIIRLSGDIPSPSNPPAGCHFHPRCPQALPECRVRYPETSSVSKTHEVRCHLWPTAKQKQGKSGHAAKAARKRSSLRPRNPRS
ncbi:MAG: dipeptide ABC transporter ATP-binding protein [Pseudomonadota bacterium]